MRPEDLKYSSYAGYLKTRHWRTTRLKALRRWGGMCENCGVAPAIEVHHRTYSRLGGEQPQDLAPLCADCHRDEHRSSATHG